MAYSFDSNLTCFLHFGPISAEKMSQTARDNGKVIDFGSFGDRLSPFTVSPTSFKRLRGIGSQIERQPKRLIRATILICGILMAAEVCLQAAQSVTLAWDPSSGPNLPGYRAHDGKTCWTCTQTLDVGNGATATISNLTPGVTYYFIVTVAAYNTVGVESASSNEVSFTATATSTPTFSLFSATEAPVDTRSWNDGSPLELGVKFQASRPSSITGIRFYKASRDTGAHTGSLWSTSGSLPASAAFSNETASGWQQVNFSNALAFPACSR
jgi:hypothetical protein